MGLYKHTFAATSAKSSPAVRAPNCSWTHTGQKHLPPSVCQSGRCTYLCYLEFALLYLYSLFVIVCLFSQDILRQLKISSPELFSTASLDFGSALKPHKFLQHILIVSVISEMPFEKIIVQVRGFCKLRLGMKRLYWQHSKILHCFCNAVAADTVLIQGVFC